MSYCCSGMQRSSVKLVTGGGIINYAPRPATTQCLPAGQPPSVRTRNIRGGWKMSGKLLGGAGDSDTNYNNNNNNSNNSSYRMDHNYCGETPPMSPSRQLPTPHTARRFSCKNNNCTHSFGSVRSRDLHERFYCESLNPQVIF